MSRYELIDFDSWPRKGMFEFYRSFDNPCFNVTVKVAAQPLYDFAKSHGESFFLLALYAILRAANEVPQMRQRFVDDRVIQFEKIAAMTPVMTEFEMFHQVWCEYEPDFTAFKAAVQPGVEAAAKGGPEPMTEHGDDFICASCVPWTHFESLTQADYRFDQAVPVLAWGRLEDGKIPVAVKLNHCFIDGLHVSRFFAVLEAGFENPESLYR